MLAYLRGKFEIKVWFNLQPIYKFFNWPVIYLQKIFNLDSLKISWSLSIIIRTSWNFSFYSHFVLLYYFFLLYRFWDWNLKVIISVEILILLLLIVKFCFCLGYFLFLILFFCWSSKDYWPIWLSVSGFSYKKYKISCLIK